MEYTALLVECRMPLVGYVRIAHVRVSNFYFGKMGEGNEVNDIDFSIK